MWIKDKDGDYINLSMMHAILFQDLGDEYTNPFHIKAITPTEAYLLYTSNSEVGAHLYMEKIMESLAIK